MKKIILHLWLAAITAFYYGCEKPAPTELTEDQDNIKVEVLSGNLDDEFYSNGFDSTGMADNPAQFTNLISVSGIKTTRPNLTTEKTSFAQAIFFDKNLPVRDPGGKLIGYITRTPGIIRFNNILARREQFRVRFRGIFGPVDTALGPRYILTGSKGPRPDPFNFDFESVVNFEFSVPGLPNTAFSLDIPTPSEINGQARVTGKFSNKDLNVVLEWEKRNIENFEIIIGAKKKNQPEVFPLYRIKTPDDGKVTIPSSLINQLPKDKFDKLNFAIVRKIEFDNSDGPDGLHIISQSIYSIEVDTN